MVLLMLFLLDILREHPVPVAVGVVGLFMWLYERFVGFPDGTASPALTPPTPEEREEDRLAQAAILTSLGRRMEAEEDVWDPDDVWDRAQAWKVEQEQRRDAMRPEKQRS